MLSVSGVHGAADTQAGGRGQCAARRQLSGPADFITQRRPTSNSRRPTDAAQQPLGGAATQRHGPTGQVTTLTRTTLAVIAYYFRYSRVAHVLKTARATT